MGRCEQDLLGEIKKNLENLSGNLDKIIVEVKSLLNQLLEEAKLNTLHTISLDMDRLVTALWSAGLLIPIDFILYDQLAPGGASTQIIRPPSGFYYLIWQTTIDVSIPWYMVGTVVYDSWGIAVDPAFPPRYEFKQVGAAAIREQLSFTGLNTHPTDDNRYHVIMRLAAISSETWDMIQKVFLDPIVAFLREEAKRKSGVP